MKLVETLFSFITSTVLNILFIPVCLLAVYATLLFVHYCGHFVVALAFGHLLRFKWSKIKITKKFCLPCLSWNMPEELDLEQRAILGIAGFGAEFASVIVVVVITPWQGALGHLSSCLYFVCAFQHLILYLKFTEPAESDFQYLDEWAEKHGTD